MPIDLDAVTAIDVHVHVEQDLHGALSMDDELLEAAAKYFKGEPHHPTVPEIAAHYRAMDMAAVVFTVDSELATGHPTLSNEEIAEAAAEHADVLIPFGSIDPARGTAGIREARRLVTEHRVFTQGVVWEINPFDQWGVELGKVMAGQLAPKLQSESAPEYDSDSSTNTLVRLLREGRGRPA